MTPPNEIAITSAVTEPSLRLELRRWCGIVTIAGVATGLLVIGVGARLAMLLLRITSDDSVRGLRSDDGVDFRVLGPRWLAISLFVAIPAVFGATVGPAVEAIERSRTIGWKGHLIALAFGPAALLSYIIVVPVMFVYAAIRPDPPAPQPLHPAVGQLARAF